MNLKLLFFSVLINLPFCCGENKHRASLPDRTEVIATLKKYFRAGFIFLADAYNHSIEDLSLEKTTISKQKFLSVHEVATVTSHTYCNVTETSCGRNFGLIVMSGYNQQIARLTLNKLSRKLRMSDFVWLLFIDRDHEMEQFFTDINIPFDCEFLVAQQYDDVIYLTEVYRISPTDRLWKYVFGNWTSDGGLTWPSIEFNERRNNLQGHTLKIGIKNGDIGSIAQEKDGKPVKAGAYLGEVLNILQYKTNFTTDFYLPPDGNYGVIMKNGSCNGICGMLQRKEIHLSLAFIMNVQRSTVMDFLAPMLSVRNYIVIKRHTKYAFSWTNFLDPFASETWMTMLSTIFLLSIFLWFTYNMTRRYERQHNSSQHYNLLTSVTAVFQGFCYQAGEAPRSTSCRIIYVTSYLASVVLLASYSAALISYLTVRKVQLPFNTFEEFLNDGTYTLGVFKHSGQHEFLKESKSLVLQRIHGKMEDLREASFLTSSLEGLKRVCQRNNYAFFTASVIAKKYNKLHCEYSFVPQAFYTADITMAIVQGSPYRKLLNHVSGDMRRCGILDILRQKNIIRTLKEEELLFSSVQMTDVVSMFMVLLSGTIIAIFILLVEITYNYINPSHREHSSIYSKRVVGLSIGKLYFR